jgi:hypothetical protein
MSTDQGQNRPNEDYLIRIDEAVALSGPLQEWLIQRSSQDTKYPSKQTKLLLDSLKEPVKAERWVSDPGLAQFLPLVLRAHSSPQDLGALDPWYRLVLKRPVGLIDILRRFYYPLAIALAAFAIFYFLSVSVIPTFQQMFSEFQLRLPSLTKLVFSIADFLINHTFFAIVQILIGIALLVGFFKLISYGLDRFEEVPWIGFFRRGTKSSLGAMARWTGTLSELLTIGMPIGRAISTAGLASRRRSLLSRSRELVSHINTQSDKPCLLQPGATSFSRSAIAAIDLHRQGANGASLLREIAQSYAVRWSSRASFSLNWLGPIVLLLVAKLVFLLVMALFLPLLSLLTSLSG